ncbi:unnamed protein product [Prorocentrum cordatum]|uniref:PPIase cyclophilin-type domain-containing protein n=1 Tax=Prorocentrum cordatum TaxID=2364126 RepID=A0ABN9SLJ1_9DINO|nr:unnamed protein product [Polarella glacialis]
MQACTGTYPGKGGISGRYQLATMSSVSKDRMLGFANFPGGNFLAKKNPAAAGEFLEKIPLAGSDTKTDEVNQLRHDQVGRVSMRKGGGSFNFVISPVKDDAPWLDEQQRVVMGQVSEGLDVIGGAELNNLKGYEKGGSILQFLPEPPGKGSSNAYLKDSDYLLVPDEKVQIWKSKDLTNNVETKLLL